MSRPIDIFDWHGVLVYDEVTAGRLKIIATESYPLNSLDADVKYDVRFDWDFGSLSIELRAEDDGALDDAVRYMAVGINAYIEKQGADDE